MKKMTFRNAVVNFAWISTTLACASAFAAPSGGSVQVGSATIAQSGTQTTVTQTSQNAVINWGSFDTASNESVQFQQPAATSVTLNRITSGQPTNFAGALSANGRIFIVNPSGIVFAKGSTVDVAGLIATTADIDNNDFMNGNYKFTLPQGSEHSSIINNGTLTAEDQGVIALIAPNVQNGDSGFIQADCGTVNLSTGKSFVVDFDGDNLINFDASSTIDSGSIKAAGKISASGGKVIMTNNAVSQTLDDVISVTGTVEATEASYGQDGAIILGNPNGSVEVKGTIHASNVGIIAQSGVSIDGSIISDATQDGLGGNVVAATISGNVAVNGAITADSFAWLHSSNGAITESDTGGISTPILLTTSSTGTSLTSYNNTIANLFAINTDSGDIDVRNNGDLNVLGIVQLDGNLSLTTYDGGITEYALSYSDDELNNDDGGYDSLDPSIFVSGTSTFNSYGSGANISLGNNSDYFGGPINIDCDGDVIISEDNSLVFDTVSVAGNFDVITTGDITQTPDGWIIAGYGDYDWTYASFTSFGGAINLGNSGNQIYGQLSIDNSLSWDQPITFYNSVDTTLEYASASGVLTMGTAGTLTLLENDYSILASNASDAPNGHSIIVVANAFDNQGISVSPGDNNSWLIYLPSPMTVAEGSVTVPGDNTSYGVFNQDYVSAPPSSIAAGNYWVFANYS